MNTHRPATQPGSKSAPATSAPNRVSKGIEVMIARHLLSTAMMAALYGLPAAPASAADESAAQKFMDANEAASAKAEGPALYYVQYEPGRQAAMRAELTDLGGSVRDQIERLGTLVVELPADAAATVFSRHATDGSGKLPGIEPVPAYTPSAQVVPWNVDQYQARDLWDVNRNGVIDSGAPTGSTIKICVIDSGIHLGHSDFEGIAITGEGEGAVGAWDFDGLGHGTHVAGTINAMNNERGVVGVVPGAADLHIVKVFNNTGAWGGGSLASAAQKCRQQGANLISMSLGGPSISATENAMFQDLYDNFGIVSVAAAGNDGNATRSYPASYMSVISVGAIARQDELAASFSQTPPSSFDPSDPPEDAEWDTVELAGGGVQILSTLPGPDGEVPNFSVVSSGQVFQGTRVTGSSDTSAPEVMPEGEVTANTVDGGRCLAGTGNASWSGAVVLCERGDATFAVKVNEVRAHGGAAVVLFNNEPGELAATCDGNCTQPSIPAVSVSQSHGQTLLAAVSDPATVIVDDGSPCVGCSGGYGYQSGTSMATPGVSGAMALIWDACGGPGELSNKDLRALVRESAMDLSGVQPGQNIPYGAGPDRVTGWGLPQVIDAIELGSAAFGANCLLNLTVSPAVQDVCTLSNTSTQFELTLSDRFQGTAMLSATGVPGGANGLFSTNPVVHPQKTSTLTVSNLQAASGGGALIELSASDVADPDKISRSSAWLNVYHASPAAPTLLEPGDLDTGVSPRATMTWAPVDFAAGYIIEVALDASFNQIVHTLHSSGTETLTPLLASRTRYYWRVRAENTCGASAESPVYQFVTAGTQTQSVCYTTPTSIPDGNIFGKDMTLVVPTDSGIIVDLDLRFEASHTWTGDLIVTLSRPGDVTALLLDRPGLPASAFGCPADHPSLTLDDEGTAGAAENQCGAGGTLAYDPDGRYTPTTPLDVFDGEDLGGTWVLNVTDYLASDAGTVNRWCLDATTAMFGNAAPTAVADSISVVEGGSADTLDTGATSVRTNDLDDEDGTPGGDVLVVDLPAHGTLTLNADGTFLYTHDGSETTSDAFTYVVHDVDGAASEPASVNISIATGNDAPAFGAAGYDWQVNELSAAGTVVGQVDASDEESDAFTFTLVDGNRDDAFALDPNTGELTVASSSAVHVGQGVFTLLVRAEDVHGASSEVAVRVTVDALDGAIFRAGFEG